MTPNYHSSSTGVPISHADEYVTSPAALPPTLPPAGSELFLGPGQYPTTGPSPAPPYTEHNLEVVGQNFMTPPPLYNESSVRVIVRDPKTLPHAYDPPIPSLRIGLSPTPGEGGSPLHIGAPRESISLQVDITVLLSFLIFILNTG